VKSSKYNISTTNPDTGETILFNTLYGSTAIIEAENAPITMELLDNPNDTPDNKELLKLLEYLIANKYIISDDIDEIEIIKNRKSHGIADNNRLDVIIMPNLDCNFACPYCYEKHSHANRMADHLETSIINWLTKVIPNYKVVMLNWFGGEPLLSYKRIISIGSSALKICRGNNVKLLSNITTNGYLFSDKIIKKLIGIRIFSYQITIDGPPEIHNKTRVLKNGKGSFDRIYNNVISLAEQDERVSISLRVNYNHHNINYIPDILTLFPEKIRKQLRIVFEPIFGDEELSATNNLSSAVISQTITEYYKLAEAMGYDVRLGGIGVGKLVYCYAERENQFIVNYNGDVFKCSVTDFSPSSRVGHIHSDGYFVRDKDNWNAWFKMKLFEEKCETCTFLPLCMGGCRKDRIENGTTGSYCNLVPSNTSHTLKSVAFNNFNEILKKEAFLHPH